MLAFLEIVSRGVDAMGRAAGVWHPSDSTTIRRRRSHVAIFDASRSLAALEQDNTIIAVIEMSKAKWLVAARVPGLKRQLT